MSGTLIDGGARSRIHALDYFVESSSIEYCMDFCGVMMGLLFLVLLQGIPGFPNSWWAPFGVIASPVLMVLCFWHSKKVGKWANARKWKKFVMDAYPELDYCAIEKTVQHLRMHTDYHTNFKSVTKSLLIALDHEAKGAKVIMAFASEVLHTYRHFATGEGEPPRSYLPKKVVGA